MEKDGSCIHHLLVPGNKIPNIYYLKVVRLILTCGFSFKVEALWGKGLAEGSHSLHGDQEAEKNRREEQNKDTAH